MTRSSPDLAARVREIALELTSWPSVTGTPDEAAFAGRFASYLQRSKSFEVWTEAVPNDAAARSNVFALKRGRSKRTIALSGHFDTVSFADYGGLAKFALNPLALRDVMIARLAQSGENALALADLTSGDFLPGRGLLDMKSGLAAGLAALESYDGEHSLLLLATSDEEDRSAGMRVAASSLKKLDLQIELVINLDAISDQGDGASGRVVAMGSVGKQLLTAFVVGKETHASYPRDGANAVYIAAELATEFELAAELEEVTGAEVAAAPTALHAKDMKSGYNVTTPAQSFIYWNTLQHRRSAGEVLEISLSLARRAVARAELKTKLQIPVMGFSELAARVEGESIAPFAREMAQRADLDFPERSKLLTQHVWQLSGLSGPAVVMGFGSIPYPAVALKDEKLRKLIADAAVPMGLSVVEYFAGISDMSFVGEATGGFSVVAANTPIWGTSFALSEPAGYPCINIGPWGRDYHHWLERLHAPYAFEALPRVLLAVIEAVFKKG
jgi:arginine utilization protein RocB